MIAAVLSLLLVMAVGYSHAADIPIIDAHSQVDHFVDLNKIIQLMDQGGVARTILAARDQVTPEQLLAFASSHAGRIVPAVRTKGGAYMRNDQRYYRLLKKQVDTGRFGAMAEVLMYHEQKGKRAPQVVVYPDDERVRAALRYALANQWPFVAHIEFVAAGSRRDRFMAQFKALLVQYPSHPFVLIHMGQLEPDAVRGLIEAHGNVYFITSHCNPITVSRSGQPWTNMFNLFGTDLSADWKRLVVEHPDRFILGFDNVFAEHWGDYYLDQVALWREVLRELPEKVAHALAHGNAERLWSLAPIKR